MPRAARGGCILERTVRSTYPRVLWMDREPAFQDELGWPVYAGEKLDGEFLPETPGEVARRRIDSALNILDDWDDRITSMGGDGDETGRRELSKIRRVECHLRRALKDLEIFR